MWFGSDGRGVPRKKTYLNEQEGRMSWTWWPNDEVGNTQESKKEIISLFGPENVFDTPKPERLVHRILHIATNPGDLVLDSFAGSGTTGAVAHKMGRRWIMVELGEHCHTHVIPRMKKVIDGEDGGGVTEAVEWKGGGGFRYYKLAPSLIVNDRWGNPVINPDYNAAQLAEALAKLEGFSYAPSELQWWQHGHSSERDFIYVTTQNLSAEQLQALSDEVGSDQSLLVCCAAFHGVSAAAAAERWPNLTLKKIPKMVLARCEWGHDDYSLNVANLPMAQPEEAQHAPRPAPGGRGKKAAAMPDLFGDDGEAT
jgi:adenine-specific DNA-methyltransferase